MKKVVIIGASGHWPYAIDGLAAVADARLVGIAPGLAAEMARVKSTFKAQLEQGVPLFEEWGAMLDALEPDVAVINPHFYHTTVFEFLSQREVAIGEVTILPQANPVFIGRFAVVGAQFEGDAIDNLGIG